MTRTTKFQLTVGIYEDMTEIGVYGTYDEAVYALGCYVLERAAMGAVYASRPVEDPEIREIR